MTVRKFIENRLEEHGLWPAEAIEVVNRLSQQDGCRDVRWSGDTEAYPPQLLAVLWFSAKSTALKYLDEVNPHHFAREVLAAGGLP